MKKIIKKKGHQCLRKKSNKDPDIMNNQKTTVRFKTQKISM